MVAVDEPDACPVEQFGVDLARRPAQEHVAIAEPFGRELPGLDDLDLAEPGARLRRERDIAIGDDFHWAAFYNVEARIERRRHRACTSLSKLELKDAVIVHVLFSLT